jgi:predicted HTH domain antitoxin
MKGTINIEYPGSLANTLKLSGKDFESEIKTTSMVKLYELGRVSSGVAARVLGLSRVDFLELLARYNVSVLGGYDADELNQDIANA